MTGITRRQLLGAGFAAGAYALARGIPTMAADVQRKLNVLFIAVDDLRPEIGCYGVPVIKTPNLDALAARGTLFNRCYCQVALCCPSRSSLLTGRRPDATGVYDNNTHFRKQLADVVTLPQHFKNQGYHVQGLSKIYHGGKEDEKSWSVPHWKPSAPQYGADTEKTRVLDEDSGKRVGPAWDAPDVPDNYFADGMTADKAIEVLQEIKDKPFFLAVGFLKPHLPFVAPKKYYDLYSPKDLKLADNPYPPKDGPAYAVHQWEGLRAYKDIPKTGPVSDEKARELIHGYYAATSYTDAQIGRVIAELDRLGLRDNTVIVVFGDHGWHLGDHGLWTKMTNFEVATRSPLIISAPGQKNPGAKTDALSEFVDIYPTLCDLAGVPMSEGLEGTSLARVMSDPKRAWKKAAFSQYSRGKGMMGRSIRTDRYRYTEWAVQGQEPAARELYDHQTDPKENVNIANLPENKALAAKLAKMLKAGWRDALPE